MERWAVAVCACFALAACHGSVLGGGSEESTAGGPSSGSGAGSAEPSTETPGEKAAALCAESEGTLLIGRTRLRRLTRLEFDNTVRDLLGVDGAPASVISPDERIGPFYSNGIAPITDLIVQQHQEVAVDLAEQATASADQIAGCDLALDTAVCSQSFIEEFGLRAYRRPLESEELAAYRELFDLGNDLGGPSNGFRLVLQTMLQSPFFLYHVDAGVSGIPAEEPVLLTSYELASRLSYFLWNSMPDDELFALAAADGLQSLDTVTKQVSRMLDDPRAKEAIASFHLQWLGINEMEDVQKDSVAFPLYDAALKTAMRAETAAFSDYVIRSGDGLLSTLFTADFSVIDGPLFDLYGVAKPSGFTPGSPTTLDPLERSGLLTQAAFLATHAHRDQTSPVHRGIIIRENLLCQPIDSPPANVNNVPPTPTPGTTTRERFAAHDSNPDCAGCHSLMDPIGLGFENYDAIGAYRTMEGDAEVDASGEIIVADADLLGTFDGAIELSHKLAGSRQVADCMANQWFRFALGRMESNDDACALQDVYEGFAASGGNVRELLARIATSDSFRHVRLIGSDSATEAAP